MMFSERCSTSFSHFFLSCSNFLKVSQNFSSTRNIIDLGVLTFVKKVQVRHLQQLSWNFMDLIFFFILSLNSDVKLHSISGIGRVPYVKKREANWVRCAFWSCRWWAFVWGRSKHFCGVSYHHGPILSQQVQQKKRSLKRSFIGFARKRLWRDSDVDRFRGRRLLSNTGVSFSSLHRFLFLR